MKKIIISLLGLTLMFGLFGVVSAADLNVGNSSTCDDVTGDPYCTIQVAINEAGSGDTINVAAGTYSSGTNGESFPITIDKSLTLKGAQFGIDPTVEGARTNEPQETVIDASGFEGNAIEISANDVILEGFTIKNMHGEPTNSSPSAKYAIKVLSQSGNHSIYSSDIVIQNNILTDNSRGIFLLDNENSLVEQNRIVRCESLVPGLSGGYYGGSGIVLSYVKSTTEITENLLSENVAKASYYGPILISYGGYATQPTITNNLITNNYRETNISYGIVLSGATAIIRNNTITGNEGGGIWSRMGSSSYFQGPETLLIIKGNVITENALEGIYIVNNLPGASITGNTVTDNGGTGVNVGTGDYTINYNNIFGNGFGVSAGVPTDAENNWWGTQAENEIAEMVNDNVDYDPWLLEPARSKATIFREKGIPGKGIENAPGLQKPFNPKSKAAENVGKK